MSNIIITGHRSQIAQEFIKLVEPGSVLGMQCEELHKHTNASKYLFCQGYLAGKSINEISPEEYKKTIEINYTLIVDAVKTIVESNPFAKICIISSYSGYKGSYDMTYAYSKNLLNQFIESAVLTSKYQQLVGIAPWIVEDAGMTLRRDDKARLEAIKGKHPMKRFASSKEVADLAYDLLFKHNYINKTVIKMHGGAV